MINKIGIVFPGGGVNYKGMGKSVYGKCAGAKSVFEEASELLNYDVAKKCFETDIYEPDIPQETIFIVSVALYKHFQEEIRVKPSFLAGHSQGEYAALVCAGVLDFKDALILVKKRSDLLKMSGQIWNGTMMAINKIDNIIIENECKKSRNKGGKVYIAVYNSPYQCILSGVKNDLIELGENLKLLNADVKLLNINTPSHCPLMKETSENFRDVVFNLKYRNPLYPIISNITGRPYNNSKEIPEMLVRQLTEPVLWNQTVKYMFKHNIKHMIDIGPNTILKNICQFVDGRILAYAFDSIEDFKAMKQCYNTHDLDISSLIKSCLTLCVASKNNTGINNQLIANSFEKLKLLNVSENQSYSVNDLSEAIALTDIILTEKGFTITERRCLFENAINISSLTKINSYQNSIN
jgi:[acyl-carrier-protein] S-malonyltransferase